MAVIRARDRGVIAMYQKALIQLAWARAGLNNTDDPKLAEFIKQVNQAQGDCWAQLAQKVRERYPEYKERLVMPIWQTGDPLLRLNLVRVLDINIDDERGILINLISGSDPRHDAPALRAASAVNHPDVLEAVARRGASVARTP
jgi:hypothetical protein